MESTTIGAAFVNNILEGARSQGYDLSSILLNSGISPSILREPRSRVTFQQLANLSLNLIELLDDENYGLMPKRQRQNTFKLLCYTLINAETVGHALHLLSQFMNIIDNDLEYSTQYSAREIQLDITRDPSIRVKSGYVFEHMMMSHHRTLCWLANARIPILRVNLDYPAPDYHQEYRYVFYGAPVNFDQPQCSLVFSLSSMNLLNVRTTEQLGPFLKQVPLTLLSQTIQSTDLSARIRSWLERQISRHQQAPDIDIAAQHFALHPQAIRRRLKKEQTSFQEIKMQTRRDLAINLLADKRRTIADIASQLDFSEASAFVRAFKQWTGLTPLAYRKLAA